MIAVLYWLGHASKPYFPWVDLHRTQLRQPGSHLEEYGADVGPNADLADELLIGFEDGAACMH